MGLTDKEKIFTILKETCLHAYLATCDGDQPRVRPVSPIVDDGLSIWVTTFPNSRKVKQITRNPKVCLAFVEQPRGDKAAYVIGEARIITDLEEKKRVWGLAPFDMTGYWPDGPESKDYCLLGILVKKIEWRDSWTSKVTIYEPSRE